MRLFAVIIIVVLHGVACQRYAERNNLPVPFEDIDDEYYSEGYDFDDNKDIYRWNVDEFPNPAKNPRYCNRVKSSYICDPDMILDKDKADKLDAYIKELYKDTPCLCEHCVGEEGGIIIGIALMKYVFQPYNEHPSQIIRSFSETLRQKWSLGKCDNDILIVVATADRLSYTDVGKATSTHISLQEAYRIFLENKAHLSSGHFYEGLSAMLGDYYKMSREIKRPVAEKLNMGTIVGSIVGAVVTLAVILLILLLLYRRYKRKSEKDIERSADEPDGERTSWTKQDIKVMFNPSATSKYQTCRTEDNYQTKFRIDEEDDEEIIDTTLATDVTGNTSASEMLDRELGEAVEGLAESYKPSKSQLNRHETNL